MKYWVLIVTFSFSNLLFSDHVVDMRSYFSKVVPFVMGPSEKLVVNYFFSVLNYANLNFKLTGMWGMEPTVVIPARSFDTVKRELKIPLLFSSQAVQVNFINTHPQSLLVTIESQTINLVILNATALPALEDGDAEWQLVASPFVQSPTWELLNFPVSN